jgi:hypothetical protein
MPYLAVQTMLDASFPRGRQYYWKAHLIQEISDTAIDVIVQYFSTVKSPVTVLGFQQLGNAANRVGKDETAFSHRDALYDLLMPAGWEDSAAADPNIEWTRRLYEKCDQLCTLSLAVACVALIVAIKSDVKTVSGYIGVAFRSFGVGDR